MDNLQKARETQLKNIQTKTGKSLDEIRAIIQASGLAKHGEIRTMLMQEFNLGHGDANSLVHYALESDGQTAATAAGLSDDAVLDEIYSGKKAGLRPLHNQIMQHIQAFGEYEIAPKKGYVSLRRKKQFAMIGPATADAIEVGINAKQLPENPRLKIMPPKSMCNYTLRLKQESELDEQLLGWIKVAFEES